MNLSEDETARVENPETEETADGLPLSRAARMTWVAGAPVLLLLGTFGNVMSIVIHRRLSAKGHAAVYVHLMALAVADLMLLYSGLLVKWVQILFDYDITDTSNFTCKMLLWFVYTCGALSAWLVVAVTMQRTVSVVWPHRAPSIITTKRSVFLVLCVICTLMLMYLHVLFGFELVVSRGLNGTFTSICTFATEDYYNFFFLVWSWFDLLVFSLVPFTILLASNTVLLKTVVTSAREARHRLSVGDEQQVVSRKKTASSITSTLVVISLAFGILTGPTCAYQLMKLYVSSGASLSPKKEAAQRFVSAVVMLMWYTNSAVNFYLYCLSGSKFRTEAKALLLELIHVIEVVCRLKSLCTQQT